MSGRNLKRCGWPRFCFTFGRHEYELDVSDFACCVTLLCYVELPWPARVLGGCTIDETRTMLRMVLLFI